MQKNFCRPSIFLPLLFLFIASSENEADGAAPHQSAECRQAYELCENATDCVHRLAILQSTCVTNTCQPQCRDAAMNIYQNREGRALLRTDTSCVPGRYELEKCGFLPMKSPKHCGFAKLICESDLECNAHWEVFVSECDLFGAPGGTQNLHPNAVPREQPKCSDKCQRHLNATLKTAQGAAFASCTCTDKEDQRCEQLQEQLRACLLQPGNNNQTPKTGLGELPLPRPTGGLPPRTGGVSESGEEFTDGHQLGGGGVSETNQVTEEGENGGEDGEIPPTPATDGAASRGGGLAPLVALGLTLVLTVVTALVCC